MSERTRARWSWGFVALIGVAAVVIGSGGTPVGASDDHDRIRELRHHGDILPLAELLTRPEVAGHQVIEAELEREDGQLVYELELLDPSGRVSERYFDAVTGDPLTEKRD